MNKVKAFIERGTDGTYGVYVDLNDETLNYGIHGDGATKQEAIDSFMTAYEDMKKIYEKDGNPFVEAEFEFVFDVVSFLEYYNQFLTLAGLSKLTGINKAQLSQYIQRYRNPSPKTTEKIQTALHTFADELKSIHLV